MRRSGGNMIDPHTWISAGRFTASDHAQGQRWTVSQSTGASMVFSHHHDGAAAESLATGLYRALKGGATWRLAVERLGLATSGAST